jgi:hypothetical protein
MIQFLTNKDLIDLTSNDYYFHFNCKHIPIATSTRRFIDTIRKVAGSRQQVVTLSYHMKNNNDFKVLASLIADTIPSCQDLFCVALPCDRHLDGYFCQFNYLIVLLTLPSSNREITSDLPGILLILSTLLLFTSLIIYLCVSTNNR